MLSATAFPSHPLTSRPQPPASHSPSVPSAHTGWGRRPLGEEAAGAAGDHFSAASQRSSQAWVRTCLCSASQPVCHVLLAHLRKVSFFPDAIHPACFSLPRHSPIKLSQLAGLATGADRRTSKGQGFQGAASFEAALLFPAKLVGSLAAGAHRGPQATLQLWVRHSPWEKWQLRHLSGQPDNTRVLVPQMDLRWDFSCRWLASLLCSLRRKSSLKKRC